MMRFRTMRYFFEESVKSLFRNSLESITAIFMVAIALLILAVSYCVALNIDYFLDQLGKTAGISVFIDESKTTEEAVLLLSKIEAIEGVEAVDYISAEKALESIATDAFGNRTDIFETLKADNPLRRSFVITLKQSDSQKHVLDELNKLRPDGVANIKDSRETVELFAKMSGAVRVASIAIVSFLGLLSIIFIMSTIRLTVNSRRFDINIMKYIGATDWFIKWPFLIEGIIIGVVGALVPVLIVCALYGQVVVMVGSSLFDNLFKLLPAYDILPLMIPLLLVFGVLIGGVASVISTKRYLRV